MRPIDKKLLKEEVHFVRLSEVNLPNVQVTDTAVRNDVVPIQLVKDIQTAASSANVKVTITSAKSGRKRELTTSGHISRHIRRLAVDISIIDGIDSHNATNALDGNREFKKKGDAFVKQLIKLGYVWNQDETGNLPKSVYWQTNKGGNHYNHIHVSNTEHEFNPLEKSDAENKVQSNGNNMNKVALTFLWTKITFHNKNFPKRDQFLEMMDTAEERKRFWTANVSPLSKPPYNIDLETLEKFEEKYGQPSVISTGTDELLNKLNKVANSETATDFKTGVTSAVSGAKELVGGAANLFGGITSFLGNLGIEVGDWMRALDVQNMTNDVVVKKGDDSETVKNVQRYLISQGFDNNGLSKEPDGKFGPETETMVKEFQKKNGLKPTGIVNDATMSLLKKGGKVSIKYIDPNDF